MSVTPQLNQRKLRQFKYLLRRLESKKQLLSLTKRDTLTQQFKKLYAQRCLLPLTHKVKQAALVLALSLGLHQAQAQVNFAARVINPYNISVSGLDLHSADLVDLDGDGDLDLVYSTTLLYSSYAYSPQLFYQENIGTVTSPNFAAAVSNPFGITLNNSSSKVTPQFVDLDGDGDMDMITASYEHSTGVGSIEYWQNTGTATAPAFAAPVLNPFGLSTSGYEMPNVNLHDIDGDGDSDFFIGNMKMYSATVVKYQENTGTTVLPAFGTAQANAFLPASPFPPATTETYMDFADLDKDGDLDLFVTYFDYYDTYTSKVGYFLNTGTATAPAFSSLIDDIYNISMPPSPNYRDLIFGDLDGDGDDDLIIVSSANNFEYYENLTPNGASTRLNFDSSSISVDESVGNINIGVNITNPSTTAIDVEVSLSMVGTADNGLDFVLTPTTLNFPANSSTVQYFSLPINDDVIVEGAEQFSLVLTNPSSSVVLGANDTLLVNIIDNDFGAPIINFDTANYSISEGGGSLTLPITITNPSSSATTVDVSIGNSSTADNNDVSFTSPVSATFGANSSVPLNITIPIVDDIFTEGTENLILSLGNVSNGGSAGVIGQTNIEILDNDLGAPIINFDTANYSISEGGGSLTLPITITNPSSSATTVDVSIGNSSTADNNDVSFTSPTNITFGAYTTAPLSITIPIVDDSLVEGTENLILSLGNVSNGGSAGIIDQTNIEILDNDSATAINLLQNIGGIEVYPNPFFKHLTLNIEHPEGKALRLVNAVGQVLVDRQLKANTLNLKTTTLPTGVYWVQIYDPKTGAALWQQRLVHQ